MQTRLRTPGVAGRLEKMIHRRILLRCNFNDVVNFPITSSSLTLNGSVGRLTILKRNLENDNRCIAAM